MVDHEKTATTAGRDEAFVAEVRRLWGRPTMTPIQAAEFDARLEARRHGYGRVFRPIPALVGVAVVALLMVPVWLGRETSNGDNRNVAGSLFEAEQVVAELMGTSDTSADDALWQIFDDDAEQRLQKSLGREYQALASLFGASLSDAISGADDLR